MDGKELLLTLFLLPLLQSVWSVGSFTSVVVAAHAVAAKKTKTMDAADVLV